MNDESSLMLFTLRGNVFALEVRHLLEVVVMDASKVPVETEPFRYRFNFRGIQSPILDLTENGMVPASMEGSLQLLIMEAQSCPIALMIDKVMEVVKGEGTVYRFPQILHTAGNRYIKAIFRIDDILSFLINPDMVLREEQVALLRAI